MICFIVLLFFFIYSFALFLIDNLPILCLTFIFNIVISLIIKVPIKKQFRMIISNIIFVTFIIICNILFTNLHSALIVGIRLFLVIHYTYIMGYYFDTTRIRIAFKYLFYPLKVLKIDTDNLALIIAIALAFIPILIDEAKMIKLSLKAKGMDFNFYNLITRPHIYLLTFINNLFDRVDELEKCLIIKGY